MVGGLADWFAVTALFRHPLGLPIPHTAIIPRNKDRIGDSLATFLQSNFLTRSEEHTSELQSLMRISYAVFCLKKHTPERKITHKTPRHKYIPRNQSNTTKTT